METQALKHDRLELAAPVETDWAATAALDALEEAYPEKVIGTLGGSKVPPEFPQDIEILDSGAQVDFGYRDAAQIDGEDKVPKAGGPKHRPDSLQDDSTADSTVGSSIEGDPNAGTVEDSTTDDNSSGKPKVRPGERLFEPSQDTQSGLQSSASEIETPSQRPPTWHTDQVDLL